MRHIIFGEDSSANWLLLVDLMNSEQYPTRGDIPDRAELSWVPQYRDEDMLFVAYSEYRKALAGKGEIPAARSKAA